MMDEIADLADRMGEKLRRGEDPGVEFEIEFGALTAAEQDEYMAFTQQQAAHGEERNEALQEDNRVLLALATLVALSDAPPGSGLGEVLSGGYVSVMQVVHTIRGAVN